MRAAAEAGLDILAVTDHDTTDALDEAVASAKGVRIVAGIEVSSTFEGHDVHILGIGVDRTHAAFQATLTRLKAGRRERVAKICAALATLGLKLSADEVLAEAGGKSVGRKHVARAMVKKGLVRGESEAFGKYLGVGSPAHIPANELSPADAVRLVRQAGGVPVLAHPGFLEDDARVERVLDESGARGIEVWHRYESTEMYKRYLDIARRRDLIATGGSDFHGDDHPNNAGLGRFLTPIEEWRRLERLL